MGNPGHAPCATRTSPRFGSPRAILAWAWLISCLLLTTGCTGRTAVCLREEWRVRIQVTPDPQNAGAVARVTSEDLEPISKPLDREGQVSLIVPPGRYCEERVFLFGFIPISTKRAGPALFDLTVLSGTGRMLYRGTAYRDRELTPGSPEQTDFSIALPRGDP